MTDLKVDFGRLQDSQSSLKSIMDEFQNTKSRVEGLDDIWSNGHVQDAMHGFSTDWEDHKGKLLKKMDDAYKHSAKCLASWQKEDASLAQSVTAKPSGGAGHSRPGAN